MAGGQLTELMAFRRSLSTSGSDKLRTLLDPMLDQSPVQVTLDQPLAKFHHC
jgi:hypothetical protein